MSTEIDRIKSVLPTDEKLLFVGVWLLFAALPSILLVLTDADLDASSGAGHDALEGAWQLTRELELAPPEVRELVDRHGATLAPVSAVLEASTRTGRRAPTREQLDRRLEAALADFEQALRVPRRGGYR
jgi:hypothetical protein